MVGMTKQALAVVVLAAGAGTRMKSATPKVLHEVAGLPLIGHVLSTASALEPDHIAVVLRHERDAVAAVVDQFAPDALLVDQDDVPGTGRAVEVARGAARGRGRRRRHDALLEDLPHARVEAVD